MRRLSLSTERACVRCHTAATIVGAVIWFVVAVRLHLAVVHADPRQRLDEFLLLV